MMRLFRRNRAVMRRMDAEADPEVVTLLSHRRLPPLPHVFDALSQAQVNQLVISYAMQGLVVMAHEDEQGRWHFSGRELDAD